MLSSIFNSIPKMAFEPAITELNAYCKQSGKKGQVVADDKEKPSRFFWFRKGSALVLSEEYASPGGQLKRRDSGKFDFEDGYWLLYCMDATREWRRYIPAPASKDFGRVFRHWVNDETGIFRG